jgi:hypothetical protein
VAAEIDRDDSMPFGELVHLLAPVGSIAGPAVHEHERPPSATYFVRDVPTGHGGRAIRGVQHDGGAERDQRQNSCSSLLHVRRSLRCRD